jgi:hypothetical protein
LEEICHVKQHQKVALYKINMTVMIKALEHWEEASGLGRAQQNAAQLVHLDKE